MRWRWGAVCAVALVCVALGGTGAARPPVEAFGNLPAMASPHLSPDGARYAVIETREGRPIVAIYTVLDNAAGPAILDVPDDWVLRALAWAKNDRLIVLASSAASEGHRNRAVATFFRAVAVDAAGRNPAGLLTNTRTTLQNLAIGDVVDFAPDDPKAVYMPLWTVPSRNDLYRVDVTTGLGERIDKGGKGTYRWFMDGHGHQVARLNWLSPFHEEIEWFNKGVWGSPVALDTAGGSDITGLSEDGEAAIRLDSDHGPFQVLTRLERGDGHASIVASKPYDIDGVIQDEWTGRVIGATYQSDKPEAFYFDDARQTLQQGLEDAFPGKSVRVESADRPMHNVIVSVDAPRSPRTFYLLDRATHAATPIGAAYPDLTAADLGEVKPYAYKARDGLTIPAYLTLPPERAPKNLPAVILPHGGPDDRDAMRFDWLAQFLANRGYLVLQPNYRGSTGYGRAFHEAGLRQWGLKMQDDISDGVAKLIADGLVDPRRVCIVGASYGGYAALAGATLTPGLYACAVSISGISDIPKFIASKIGWADARHEAYQIWKRRIGTRDDDSEQLRATSPARLADQIRCPILLVHGENDTTVPISQSEIMDNALQAAGKPVTFLRLKGDDHYLLQAASRIALLKATEAFLSVNIGS